MTTTILVTGGAGYIGSHVCQLLARAGYLPVAYDNMVHGHEWAVQWGPLEVGDIHDRARLAQVIEAYRPAAVMHFAAFAYVGESVENPSRYYHNNVMGSLSLLEAMRGTGLDRIIFSSTCAVYGIAEDLITETMTPQPINPYGASKLMVERLLQDYGRAYGLRYTALRYFNAAGADPSGCIGEVHDPEPHLFPRVLAAALGDLPEITVFGEDYPTPDGTCIRDYVHVQDLARAHVMALERLLGDSSSEIVNLGTGRGYSVREIIAAVERATGSVVPVTYGPRRAGDPPWLIASAAKAQVMLGWKPESSDIDIMVGTALAWMRGRR